MVGQGQYGCGFEVQRPRRLILAVWYRANLKLNESSWRRVLKGSWAIVRIKVWWLGSCYVWELRTTELVTDNFRLRMVAWRVHWGAKDLIKFAVWNGYELLGKDHDQLLHEGELNLIWTMGALWLIWIEAGQRLAIYDFIMPNNCVEPQFLLF